MKKLRLQRETLQALQNPLTEVVGGFSGIGTCIYCNATKVVGGCGTSTTIQ